MFLASFRQECNGVSGEWSCSMSRLAVRPRKWIGSMEEI
jgi:hypothetical protein